MSTEMFESLSEKLGASMVILKRDLSGLRTGRASSHLMDGVIVEAYGGRIPLTQTASVSVVDTKTISVQVWDNGLVKHVAKAIEVTMGLNPIVEGQSIRVILPDLTEERRREFCKLATKFGEAIKISSRGVRRDFMDRIKKMEKDKEINEDEERRLSDQVQKVIDEFSKSVDHLLAEKEKEIMKI